MTVCHFFLQGRCRYGDKCWNEHPRGGVESHNYNRSSAPQQSRGGGGGMWFIVLCAVCVTFQIITFTRANHYKTCSLKTSPIV